VADSAPAISHAGPSSATPQQEKMMSNYVKMRAIAAAYDSVEAAQADYQIVKDLYYGLNLMDTFDAAVVHKNEKGKVKIVSKHEQPTRQGAWRGAGWGLAGGLVVALFPAAALGAGLLANAAGLGAMIGALAGHAVGGVSRSDLKDLGELLDNGQAGLVVITATDIGDRVANALKSARKYLAKDIEVDEKDLENELASAKA
jgi:uncharacterized membrane protein